MINSTNGVKINDKPVSLEDQAALAGTGLINVDVSVPKIGLNDSDSESDNASNNNDNDNETKSTATELNDNSNIKINTQDIIFGKFENINDIYNSQIVEFDVSDDTKINKLSLQDFTSLAFKLKSENFAIFKPQYE